MLTRSQKEHLQSTGGCGGWGSTIISLLVAGRTPQTLIPREWGLTSAQVGLGSDPALSPRSAFRLPAVGTAHDAGPISLCK